METITISMSAKIRAMSHTISRFFVLVLSITSPCRNLKHTLEKLGTRKCLLPMLPQALDVSSSVLSANTHRKSYKFSFYFFNLLAKTCILNHHYSVMFLGATNHLDWSHRHSVQNIISIYPLLPIHFTTRL